MSRLQERLEETKALGEDICRALATEINQLGLPEPIEEPRWSNARFSLQQDPALGSESLEVLWLGERGEKLGGATLHEDGSFFAEYDIIRPHPHKSKWFVEAVTAWGRDNTIKSEPRLLPIPE